LPGVGLVTARKIIEKLTAGSNIDSSCFERSKFSDELNRLLLMIDNAGRVPGLPAKIELIRDYYLPILRARETDYPVRILDINVLVELASKYDSLI
ncbi:hypothetical protein PTM75_14965, partial [Clostridium perfringens]|nr:hypothetical protein [Clostridium perfringens]